jgi:hypothetical protein
MKDVFHYFYLFNVMYLSLLSSGVAERPPALSGALPDVALLIDDVIIGVVGLERAILVVVGTAAEQLLPVVNLHDRRRGFQISSLHNCYLLLFLFDDYLELRSSSFTLDKA